MPTLTLYATEYALCDANNPAQNIRGNTVEILQSLTTSRPSYLLLRFTLPSQYYQYEITAMRLYCGLNSTESVTFNAAYAMAVLGSWNASTVTWNTRPQIVAPHYSGNDRFDAAFLAFNNGSASTLREQSAAFLADDEVLGLRSGSFAVESTQDEVVVRIGTPLNTSFKPRLEIDYVTAPPSPLVYGIWQPNNTSGTRTYKELACGLKVFFKDPARSYTPLTLATGNIVWRPKGTAEAHQIMLTQGLTEQTITFAANTFPAGKIEWRVFGSSQYGTSMTSDWTEQEILSLASVPVGTDKTRGFLDETQAQTFRWSIPGYVYDMTPQPEQVSAVFRYRADEDNEPTEIEIEGATKEVTIPADTFEGETVQWQVEVTNNYDAVGTSPWYTLSLVDALSSATITAPRGVLLDGSIDQVFRWEHVITTGTRTQGAELQQSTDGSTWSSLATVSEEGVTEITIPADTFTAGTHYWRVRTKNSDGVAGSWSEAAQIQVAAAPDAPGITVEREAPRFRIRWAAEDQVAYRISVDGVETYGFGAAANYTYPGWLPDGTHTVAVQTQNAYSFWSAWSTATLTIANVPGNQIALTASAGAGASVTLTWDAPYQEYEIYRGDTLIGRTAEASFTDQFAAPGAENRYQIRAAYDGSGNYAVSNSVAVTPEVTTLWIYGTASHEWLQLPLAATQLRQTALNNAQQTALTHYAGRQLPSVEYGEQTTVVYQFACAFQQGDPAAEQFRSLLGSPVCIKDQYGTCLIGALSAIDQRIVQTHRAFTCTVEAIDAEEVDLNG